VPEQATQQPDVLEYLRRETRSEHRTVERAFDFKGSTRSLGAYRKLLERLWGLHLIWEQRALNVLDVATLGPRLKAHWLQADLRDLGLSDDAIGRIALCSRAMDLRSASCALGAMYVLEGSTLGGQIIYQHAAEKLSLSPERYGRFFYGYGGRTNAMWKGFGGLVQQRYDDGQLNLDEVLAGAKSMFAAVTEWLQSPHPQV
jgi:heme oxygenase (biliverdin-IX-beta and delta-forming)